MSTLQDDPMLTAFALGELEGEEARAVEAQLAADPAAAAYVEEIRATAKRLTGALRAEPAVGSSGAKDSDVAGRIGPSQPKRRPRWPVILAAAAAVGVLGLTAWLTMPDLNRARQVILAENKDRPDVQGMGGSTETAETLREQALARRTSDEAGHPAPQPEPDFRNHLSQNTLPGGAPAEGADLDRRSLAATLPPSAPAQQQGQGSVLTTDSRPRAGAGGAGDPGVAADRAPESVGPGFAGGGEKLADADAAVRRETQSHPAAGASARLARPAEAPAAKDKASLGAEPQLPADLQAQLNYPSEFNTEQYDRVVDNPFTRVADHPLSTFGVDVDTASYSITRRFLSAGQLPPPDAVRVEELVNYFDYAYAPPASEAEHPFAAHVAVTSAPWNPQHRLVRIGIKGKEIASAERPASNLVFLLDVSGSMNQPNKLPLVLESMRMLTQQLDERDRVAIVVYAGSSGLVLPSTTGDRKELITAALEQLRAGGSTNGAQGIQLAYETARQGFIKGGVNRVILCTDGDFNVGVTDRGQLTRLIEEQAKSGVYLSVLGFGMGNYKDATMEELSNKGEGNYGYIDTEHEARKLLVEQMSGTLVSIAKDMKIQVEFNPAVVGSYRLIGYENRVLAKEDFNDDTKDAGDIGAGHEVTALYEVVPVHVEAMNVEAELNRLRDMLKKYEELQAVAGPTPDGRPPHEAEVKAIRERMEQLNQMQPPPPVDDLRYQEKPRIPTTAAASWELLTVKLRYKALEAPKEQGTSMLVEFPVKDEGRSFERADADFRHAAAVSAFGMLLRNSPYRGSLTWAGLEEIIRALPAPAPAADPTTDPVSPEIQRRVEFQELVRRAAALHAPGGPEPR